MSLETTLPPPPSDNPTAELLHLITAFSAEVDNVIEGRESFEYLIRACRPALDSFTRDIRSTAPRMRPFMSDTEDKIQELVVDGDAPKWGDNEALPAPVYLPQVRSHIERFVPFQTEIIRDCV